MTCAHVSSRREPGSYGQAGALTDARDLLRTVRHRVMLVRRARGLGRLPPGAPRREEAAVPDIAEMDSYAMLCEDWGSAYQITRTPGQEHPYAASWTW